MINPFISIDEQLNRHGWVKYFENKNGFRFVKKIGVDVYFYASFNKLSGISFYDEVPEFRSIETDEKTLELFAAKIKEWRRQYERNTESKRASCKKQS